MTNPHYLNELNPDDEDLLNVFNLLENTCVTLASNKMGRARSFGTHRGMILGMIKGRAKPIYALSYVTKKYPELYKAVMKLGHKIVPFEFNAIQVNHNVVCPPHLDKGNKTESVIVSMGDYEGCNLVIEDHGEFNTNCKPLVFNGKTHLHWNTPLISGTKYSLVFFINEN